MRQPSTEVNVPPPIISTPTVSSRYSHHHSLPMQHIVIAIAAATATNIGIDIAIAIDNTTSIAKPSVQWPSVASGQHVVCAAV